MPTSGRPTTVSGMRRRRAASARRRRAPASAASAASATSSRSSSAGSAGGAARSVARRAGNDLRYDLEITFQEAVFGAEKEIEIPRLEVCPQCQG